MVFRIRPRHAAVAVALGCLALPELAAAAPPANDGYLQSISVNAPGSPLPREDVKDARDTREATVQADLFAPPGAGGGPEPTRCGGAPIGKTVWYDFHPDAPGTAEIQAGGYDATVAVYEFDPRTTRLTRAVTCANNPPGAIEDVFVEVERGKAYTVQIGGVDAGAGPAGGNLQFGFEFFPDRDRDGIFDPLDRCPSTPGTQARGGCPLELRSTPKLRAMPTRSGLRARSLSVQAPRGARVRVRCRRRCSFTQSRTVGSSRAVRFSRLRGRRLPTGARLEILVTRSGAIGSFHRYTITRGNFRRIDRCVPPGSTKPRKKCS